MHAPYYSQSKFVARTIVIVNLSHHHPSPRPYGRAGVRACGRAGVQDQPPPPALSLPPLPFTTPTYSQLPAATDCRNNTGPSPAAVLACRAPSRSIQLPTTTPDPAPPLCARLPSPLPQIPTADNKTGYCTHNVNHQPLPGVITPRNHSKAALRGRQRPHSSGGTSLSPR